MPGTYQPGPQKDELTLGTPVLIETENEGGAINPQVAIDARGNAVAVWRQSDGTRFNIWANSYTVRSGWGVAEPLETDSGDVEIPQVAMDTTGNAFAIWAQAVGARYSIRASRYTAGSGWGSAEEIETDDAGDAYFPHVAFDVSGNAVAVWNQSDGIRYNIRANRYTVGKGWGIAELIETDDVSHAHRARVAVDPSGNAIAVWDQHNDTLSNVWANRYTAGKGWGTAELIETENAGNVYSPQVAIDSRGNAVAVWQQYNGNRANVWANRYTAGVGWGTAELLETDDAGSATPPQVGVGAAGNAVAVWAQFDGSAYNVWANRYTVGTGWGTAELIEPGAGSSYPKMAVDSMGNAIVVGQIFTGTNDVWVKNFIVDTGWSAIDLLESDTEDAAYPQVAVNFLGNAIAVWSQHDGSHLSIWANHLAYSGSNPGVYTPANDVLFIPDLQIGGNQMHADAAGKAYNVWLSRLPAQGYVFELTGFRRIPVTDNPSATFDAATGTVDIPVVMIPGWINNYRVILVKKTGGYVFDLKSAKKN